MPLAATPEPPYYAVIFSSRRTPGDNGYGAMADRMAELSRAQPGFIGMDHAGSDGIGLTVCYWASLEAIAGWRNNVEHLVAQAEGKARWYEEYRVRIARVERAYP